MRNRSLLHITKLNDFLSFVSESLNYEIMEVKGEYESFRIKHISGTLIIGYKKDKTDHITVSGNGLLLVNKFLKVVKDERD